MKLKIQKSVAVDSTQLDKFLNNYNLLQEKLDKSTHKNQLTSKSTKNQRNLNKNAKTIIDESDDEFESCSEADDDDDDDEYNKSLMILDHINPFFNIRDIKNKINPSSACKLYNCNGKGNSNQNKKTHRSINNCQRYESIKDKTISRTEDNISRSDSIIGFSNWLPGKTVVIILVKFILFYFYNFIKWLN